MGRNGRATLADIARLAKVDSSTVSLVLNRKPLAERLSAETRERVFAAARELNYQPSFAARTLKTGRSGAFGMVVGDLRDPSYSMLAFHLITAAQARGYQVLTCPTPWGEEKELALLRLLHERNVDGVFFQPGSFRKDPEFYETLRQEKFPVVTYCTPDPVFATVGVNYEPGFRQAVADLARRHRKIGHICSPHTDSRPLTTVCKAAGVEPVEHRFRHIGLPDCADEVAEFVRTSGSGAFIVSGSATAVRLMSRLARKGIRVPDDVELVGVGNLEATEWVQPELSCIGYDVAAMMEKAVEMLIDYPSCEPGRSFMTPSEYIVRQSTRP